MRLPTVFSLLLLASSLAPPLAHADTPSHLGCVAVLERCLELPGKTASNAITISLIERKQTPEQDLLRGLSLASLSAPTPSPHSTYDPSMAMELVSASVTSPNDLTSTVTQPATPDDAISLVPQILKDFQAGGAGTLLGAGLLVMVLVYVFRAFVLPHTGLQPSVLPFVALGLGVLGGIGMALASGQALVPAILSGVVGALGASGGHEVLTALGVPVPQSTPAPKAGS